MSLNVKINKAIQSALIGTEVEIEIIKEGKFTYYGVKGEKHFFWDMGVETTVADCFLAKITDVTIHAQCEYDGTSWNTISIDFKADDGRIGNCSFVHQNEYEYDPK